MAIQTEILLYDHFEELDALGPYSVLVKSGFDVALVTAEPTDRIEAADGTIVTPHRELSETSSCWLFRGARGRNAVHVARGPKCSAACCPRSSPQAMPVEPPSRRCARGPFSSRPGLLDGRPATTHHDDFDDLEGTAAPVIRDARVVDDGDIITAGGVTSGIDMGLWLAEKHMGAEVADRAAAILEHPRDTRVWRAT